MSLFRKLSSYNSELNVQVAMDNHLILDEIRRGSEDEAAEGGKRIWKRPLLLFIPLRLGLTELNPIYFADLKVIVAPDIVRNFLTQCSYGRRLLLTYNVMLCSL